MSKKVIVLEVNFNTVEKAEKFDPCSWTFVTIQRKPEAKRFWFLYCHYSHTVTAKPPLKK